MRIAHIQKLFIHILDLIFPPSEDLLIVRIMTLATISTLFHEQHIHGNVVLSEFRDPRVRALIHEAKFHGNKKAFVFLSRLIDIYLERHHNEYDVIIPIPLSNRRKRTRGYNQIHEILKACAQYHTIDLMPNLLKRTRDTRPQTDLSYAERLTNLHDAFVVTNASAITNKRILIIDDVMTTGTTLTEAHDTLLFHNPKSITLLALAH